MKILTLLRHVWSIEDLRVKIYYTLIYTGIFIGISYVLMPGIVMHESVFDNPFVSIAALGLAPYISSTVLVGFFTANESKRIKYSRILAIIIAAIQAPSIYLYLQSSFLIIPNWSLLLFVLISTATTAVCIYISEKITEKGICDGRDLLMGVSTLLVLPKAVLFEFSIGLANNQLFFFIFDLLLLFLSVGIALLLSQSLINIPIQIASEGETGNQKEENILTKLNPADDYPINFAMAIQFLPLTFIGYFTDSTRHLVFSDSLKCIILFLITFIATFVFVARQVTPQSIIDNFVALKGQENSHIGTTKEKFSIKENEFEKIIFKGTVVNASLLGFLAILPIVSTHLGVSIKYGELIGGASIIFVVNFVTGALYTFDNYLYQNGFETFEELCHGRLLGKDSFYLSNNIAEPESEQG
jgi:preprotein translocase subunit SecY